MALPTFRAAQTGHVDGGTSFSVNKPTGTASGDLLLLFVFVDVASSTATITPPSGFTEERGIDVSGPAQYRVYKKTAGGSEPASYTVSLSAARDASGVLVALQSAGGDPLAVDVSAAAQGPSNGIADAPSVTTTGADRLVLVAGGFRASTGITYSGTGTVAASVENVANLGASQEVAHFDKAAAGATGTQRFTGSGSGAALTVAVYESNTAPTCTLASPADAATVNDPTPTLTATVGDSSSGAQTITTHFQVATDAGFTSIHWEGDSPTTFTSPATNQSISVDVGTALADATTYYWRAKATDGVGGDSGYTAARSFTTALYAEAPTLSGPTGTVVDGTKTLSWTYNGGLTQSHYAVRRSNDGGVTYEYWNASTTSWQATEVQNAGSDSSISTAFAGSVTAWQWSVKTWNSNGAGPYAADATFTVHDEPTATVTAPTGTVTTGGPDLNVTWTYSQAQSVAQARYRVTFTNDAGTTTYYDSGWLSGTATSLTVDLVAEGVPTDSADVTVKVEVESADGTAFQGSDTEALDLQWGTVTTTITSPADNGTVTTTKVTATWTFSSTRSKAQGHYRVKLSQSGVVLADTGWVAGTATSHEVDYILADQSTYTLEVQTKNTEGVIG